MTLMVLGSLAVVGAAGYVWDRVRRGRPGTRHGSGGARARYYRDGGDPGFGQDQASSGWGGGPGW